MIKNYLALMSVFFLLVPAGGHQQIPFTFFRAPPQSGACSSWAAYRHAGQDLGRWNGIYTNEDCAELCAGVNAVSCMNVLPPWGDNRCSASSSAFGGYGGGGADTHYATNCSY